MLSKITPKIAPITSSVAKTAQNVSISIGKRVNGSNLARKAIKIFDANGTDNSFITLTTLMVSTVIIPRFLTAKNRNPNDKEATKDEVEEILFRDIQTCAIILFALKMLNSIISSKVGKNIGLPMTNTAFEKIFKSKGILEKAQEFVQTPKDILSKLGKNLLNLAHPTGGVKALKDSEYISKYSGMGSLKEILKMLNTIDSQGGNSKKILRNYMFPDLISKAQETLKKLKNESLLGLDRADDIKSVEKIIKKLNSIKDADNVKSIFINGTKIYHDNQDLHGYILDYFKDKNNGLVQNGRYLNAGLRTMALTIESLYLGFGIPALNQRRLEKKYLSKHPTKQLNQMQNDDQGKELISNIMTSDEMRLFSKFA